MNFLRTNNLEVPKMILDFSPFSVRKTGISKVLEWKIENESWLNRPKISIFDLSDFTFFKIGLKHPFCIPNWTKQRTDRNAEHVGHHPATRKSPPQLWQIVAACDSLMTASDSLWHPLTACFVCCCQFVVSYCPQAARRNGSKTALWHRSGPASKTARKICQQDQPANTG